MTSILPLTPAYGQEVAKLHLAHLPTGFGGTPGLKLLQAYYVTLLQSGGGGGVVTKRGGQVLGFACAVWAPAAVRMYLVRSRWPTLISWGTVQALIRPWLVGEVVRRWWGTGRAGTTASSGYEIRPVVVVPAARGRGIGAKLVNALLADAAGRGFDRVCVLAEEDDQGVNAFYRKLGFRAVGKVHRSGLVYLRYEKVSRP